MEVEILFRKNKAFANATIPKFFWSQCPFPFLKIIENPNNKLMTYQHKKHSFVQKKPYFQDK